MSTIVKVFSHSNSIQPKFPERCIYCCGPSDAGIELNITRDFTIGSYSTTLSKEFGIPWAPGTKNIKGIDIRTVLATSRNKSIKVDCTIKGDVPYCTKHRELNGEIERALQPSEKKYFIFAVPGAVIGIFLGLKGIIPIFEDQAILNAMVNLVFFAAIGAGLAYIIHKISGYKGPPEIVDYLKGSFLKIQQGALGWRCRLNGPLYDDSSRAPGYVFLKDPKVLTTYEFINDEYARLFAKANNAEIDVKRSTL